MARAYALSCRNYFDFRAGEHGYVEYDIRIYCKVQIEYHRKHVNTMILQRNRVPSVCLIKYSR